MALLADYQARFEEGCSFVRRVESYVSDKRTCAKCGVAKHYTEFYPRQEPKTKRRAQTIKKGSYLIKRQSWCAECCKKASLDFRNRDVQFHRARNREWIKNHPQEVRANRLKNEYGMSMADYDAKVQAQNGVCEICKRAPVKHAGNKYGFVVDHDHKNGKTRGLLCQRCNVLLGKAEDDPELLQRFIDYLRRYA